MSTPEKISDKTMEVLKEKKRQLEDEGAPGYNRSYTHLIEVAVLDYYG